MYVMCVRLVQRFKPQGRRFKKKSIHFGDFIIITAINVSRKEAEKAPPIDAVKVELSRGAPVHAFERFTVGISVELSENNYT